MTSPLYRHMAVTDKNVLEGTEKGSNMNISVTCGICAEDYTVTCTRKGYEQWKGGAFIQDAMPELPAAERELLLSKTCGPCFDAVFPEDEGRELEEC